MKKLIKILKYAIFLIIILVIIYFFYGIITGVYLNKTLTKEVFFVHPSEQNIFSIHLIKADNLGRCETPYYIYPWQYPGDCTAAERSPDPFHFSFVKVWENGTTVKTFMDGFNGFKTTRNWFFKEKNMVICLDNFKEPLYVAEDYYYDSSFVFPDILGIKYKINNLTPEQSEKWKEYINNSIANKNFSKKAMLIRGSNCDKVETKNILKQFNVQFSLSNQTKSEHDDIIF